MTNNDWIIDAEKIVPLEVSPMTGDIDILDNEIEQLYKKANLPFDIKAISDYAKHLNVSQTSDRVPWVYKLLEMDYSLGPGGFALRFNLKTNLNTYAFFQLIKYDQIYRPMKYVYMPFGMAICPSAWSRDIAENACAHVEKCVKNLFEVKNLRMSPKATLGKMANRYPTEFNNNTFDIINSVNDIIYGKTKHQFEVQLPRQQLLSLTESLAVYFVCRVLGLRLLQQAGTLNDIENEIDRGRSQKGIYLGMEWAI